VEIVITQKFQKDGYQNQISGGSGYMQGTDNFGQVGQRMCVKSAFVRIRHRRRVRHHATWE